MDGHMLCSVIHLDRTLMFNETQMELIKEQLKIVYERGKSDGFDEGKIEGMKAAKLEIIKLIDKETD